DAARSILDGHIVLSRRLANAKHFPAIDVLESVSRVRDEVITKEQQDDATLILKLEAAYRTNEDLIAVGAYKGGADRMVDTAIALRSEGHALLHQPPTDRSDPSDVRARLARLAGAARAQLAGAR